MTTPPTGTHSATTPAVALTIAGSDSGGGAGIQADLRAFGANGAFGASVITAVTAQNTVGVDAVHLLPTGIVDSQLDSVLSDLPVAAVKTGMLATAELVGRIADRAEAGALPRLVVDPVLVSATGHRLLDEDALRTYRDRLLPQAQVVTPNLAETEALLGVEIADLDTAADAARALVDLGVTTAVVKGGHLEGPDAVDVVAHADGTVRYLTAPRIDTSNVHGTGCTFAAAIAALLASDLPVDAALDAAKTYVTATITGAVGWRLGAGCGPLDHLGFTADHVEQDASARG